MVQARNESADQCCANFGRSVGQYTISHRGHHDPGSFRRCDDLYVLLQNAARRAPAASPDRWRTINAARQKHGARACGNDRCASSDYCCAGNSSKRRKEMVGRIFQETSDVKTLRLMNPLGGPLPFTYLPGQFITVALAPDNQLVKRSYTIASSPTQHDYVEITVKHENEGIVSGFLHNHVKEGDLLDFSGPSGFFTFTGRECKCILLIAGGVGITPLMSVLRYLTDRSWPGDVFLLYCIKTPRDIIFREELDYLQ